MRYYFDINSDGHWVRDDIGIDCRNDLAARHQAVLGLTELARETLPADGSEMTLQIRVRKGPSVAFTVRLEFSAEPGPALSDPAVAPHRVGQSQTQRPSGTRLLRSLIRLREARTSAS